ncbi:FAD dependent oxidoreductase [Microstroma glucosiphilum]|uniref:FAD dependent oxidoreductase n=1 Tax=Pseudomicrostroma glucosiphilum TaxID=1684307 RepID=A0A316UD96_9BASI|nr:FAD dependent oxidoreductase [Pseudomicrostroma glucosiphilum]PWN22343.1 FAD dependent oxidoreductase [Pseudomicrostroma glucosiphilum]
MANSSSPSSSSSSAPQHIVVGAGVFGTSTALAAVQAGHGVTVLDRSSDGFVAPDGASSDLNKIIRADYSDPFYRVLGKGAISEWRTNPLYSPYYHEDGVFFYSGQDGDPTAAEFMKQGVHNAAIASDVHFERMAVGVQLPKVAHLLASEEEGKACFPPSLRNRVGGFMSKMGTGATSGYCNPRGGWAEARNATVAALQEAQRLGAQLVGNAEVSSLIRQDSKVVGVKTSDGRSFTTRNGGAVIICAGSWTTDLLLNSLLPPTLGKALGEPASTSGQTVITVKLGEEDRLAHKGAPVTFNIQTGFYTFAPDASGVLKAAIHGPGYSYPAPPCGVVGEACAYPSFSSSSSAPSTSTAPSPKGILGGRAMPFQPTIQTGKEERVPEGKDREMLQQLLEVYPGLEKYKETLQTRICWYSDTEDENWIIDGVPGQHPGEKVENLFIATGDSGHGFKFLPTIGKFILGRLPSSQRPASIPALTEEQSRFWSLEHHRRLKKEVAAAAAKVRKEIGDAATNNLRGRL